MKYDLPEICNFRTTTVKTVVNAIVSAAATNGCCVREPSGKIIELKPKWVQHLLKPLLSIPDKRKRIPLSILCSIYIAFYVRSKKKNGSVRVMITRGQVAAIQKAVRFEAENDD